MQMLMSIIAGEEHSGVIADVHFHSAEQAASRHPGGTSFDDEAIALAPEALFS